jgi:uncharacterized membrane protein YtjA (UPF0391 family)
LSGSRLRWRDRGELSPPIALAMAATEVGMLKLALFFLIVSIIAALFGFTGIAAASAGIARVLFLVFVVVFVVLLVSGLMMGSALF